MALQEFEMCPSTMLAFLRAMESASLHLVWLKLSEAHDLSHFGREHHLVENRSFHHQKLRKKWKNV